MPRFISFLYHCRQSSRLIQSLALAFVLGLVVATASPLVQAHNYSPDSQTICLGNGGMAVITFTADGTPIQSQASHGLDCPLCLSPPAPPPALNQTAPVLPLATNTIPAWLKAFRLTLFEDRSPPARAPPLAS